MAAGLRGIQRLLTLAKPISVSRTGASSRLLSSSTGARDDPVMLLAVPLCVRLLFQASQAQFTPPRGTQPEAVKSQLVREFIHDSLYHPQHGYFSSVPDAVGALREPINFASLSGQAEYTRLLQRLYAEHDVAWFTPSELFQPWYGHAVADRILTIHRQLHTSQPIKVYEVGAGSGTCAVGILDYLKHNSRTQVAYDGCDYKTLEISSSLAQRQASRVEASGHGRHFSTINGSAIDPSTWGGFSDEACYVLLFEVLDNLPHDRVVWQAEASAWQETWVQSTSYSDRTGSARPALYSDSADAAKTEEFSKTTESVKSGGFQHSARPLDNVRISHSNTFTQRDRSEDVVGAGEGRGGAEHTGMMKCTEQLRPLSDPLICDTMSLYSSLHSKSLPPYSSLLSTSSALLRRMLLGLRDDITWLPTMCMELLRTIHRLRPNATIIAADFSFLPEVQIEGRNAPLVASKAHGETVDSSTYLVPRGSSDIFFPTDFRLLEELDRQACKDNNSRMRFSVSSQSFLSKFTKHGETQDGFNPLLHDFTNTRFFVSRPT